MVIPLLASNLPQLMDLSFGRSQHGGISNTSHFGCIPYRPSSTMIILRISISCLGNITSSYNMIHSLMPYRPSLRTYLCTHWQRYKIHEVYTSLTETQNFTCADWPHDSQPLFYDTFNHALALGDDFMMAMWDIRNLRLGNGFATSYPELFNLIHTDYAISNGWAGDQKSV
jgi:hypothetical protein